MKTSLFTDVLSPCGVDCNIDLD